METKVPWTVALDAAGFLNPMPLARDMARPGLRETPLRLHKTFRVRASLLGEAIR